MPNWPILRIPENSSARHTTFYFIILETGYFIFSCERKLLGYVRDETMDDKLLYIPNNDGKLKLLTLNLIIVISRIVL